MHKPQGLPHDLYICNIKRDEELLLLRTIFRY